MKSTLRKIGILTFWEFPEGLAPTTRILAYSKGLIENQIDVEIFSFRRIFKDDSETIKKTGIINGAKFFHIHLFNTLGRSFKLVRVIDEIILRIKVLAKIYQSNKKKSFSLFFFSFDDINSFSAYIPIFKFFSFPLVFVADEFPIPIRDFMKDEVPDDLLRKYKYYHKSFSARILMTMSLQRYYDEKIFPKPTFILNTIIDASRFTDEIYNVKNIQPFLCYMGNLDLRKDNVQNIIEAFYLVESEFPELELHLYGVASETDYRFLTGIIEKYCISNKVFFKGKAGYLDVPRILTSSTILVNSQPKTKRAEGGFPTKLGEYLLSTKPSIFTDSGDISKYIQDGMHGYLVPPENPAAFAKKISFILNNYNQALKVAQNGSNYIKNHFDAKRQTKEMIKFLEDNLHK